MITRLKLCILVFLIAFNGMVNAQYVPKKQRFKKDWINKIEIPRGGKLVLKKNRVYCDTLVMHDQATLKIDSVQTFHMFANFVQIGKKCVIDANGKAGKKLALLRDYATTMGQSGKKLFLTFNIYKLGSLKINTRGGKAGKAYSKDENIEIKRLGIGGSGGDITFHYYAPFVIMKQRRARSKPNVWFETDIGEMRVGAYTDNVVRLNVAGQYDNNVNHLVEGVQTEQNRELSKRKKGKVQIRKSYVPITR